MNTTLRRVPVGWLTSRGEEKNMALNAPAFFFWGGFLLGETNFNIDKFEDQQS